MSQAYKIRKEAIKTGLPFLHPTKGEMYYYPRNHSGSKHRPMKVLFRKESK